MMTAYIWLLLGWGLDCWLSGDGGSKPASLLYMAMLTLALVGAVATTITINR